MIVAMCGLNGCDSSKLEQHVPANAATQQQLDRDAADAKARAGEFTPSSGKKY